jgi:hypothetical protein
MMQHKYIFVDKEKVRELADVILKDIADFRQTHELNGSEVLSAMFEALYVLARTQKQEDEK